MMKGTKLLLILLLFRLVGSSQDTLLMHPFMFTAFTDQGRISFPVFDATLQYRCMVIMDHVDITILQMDESFQVIQSLSAIRPSLEFTLIDSDFCDEGILQLTFFCSRTLKSHIIRVDLMTGRISIQALSVEIKGERFFCYFKKGSSVFIVTQDVKSPTLRARNILIPENVSMEFDLSGIGFANAFYAPKNWDEPPNPPFRPGYLINEMRLTDQQNTKLGSFKRKFYMAGDQLIMTYDEYENRTSVIILNLVDQSVRYKEVQYSGNELFQNDEVEGNSFLLGNLLFQIQCSQSALVMSITDIMTDSVRKVFTVSKHDDISFKNSPYIQTGSTSPLASMDSQREIYSTASMLRKISGASSYLLVNQVEDSLIIDIGSYKLVSTKAIGGPPVKDNLLEPYIPGDATRREWFHPLLTSVGGSFINHPNNAYYSFPSTVGTTRVKEVGLTSLLNANTLDHMPGEYLHKDKDNIDQFLDKLTGLTYAKTVFHVGQIFLLGFYQNGTYYLIRF